MATSSVAAPMQHSSNAEFQAWATEFYNALIAVGLTQTADTGQLAAPVVAARPAINTDAGYWIFRFNDTQQASAPIYIKVAPGTAGTAGIARLNITTGTGTNGAGTLTGIGNTVQTMLGNAAATLATNRTSRFCYVAGFLGVHWKIGAGAAGGGCLYIQRTVDNAGVATAGGASILVGSPGTGTAIFAQNTAVDYVTATAFDAGSTANDRAVIFIPNALLGSSTTAAGDLQIFQAWAANRKLFPLMATPVVLRTEFADGATFSVAMVGTTMRTYITGGDAVCGFPDSRLAGWLAMIWE